jgi:hypothetical protein
VRLGSPGLSGFFLRDLLSRDVTAFCVPTRFGVEGSGNAMVALSSFA